MTGRPIHQCLANAPWTQYLRRVRQSGVQNKHTQAAPKVTFTESESLRKEMR